MSERKQGEQKSPSEQKQDDQSKRPVYIVNGRKVDPNGTPVGK